MAQDIPEKLPAPNPTNVMEPESGSYGAVAEVDRLQSDMQPLGPPPQSAPPPTPMGGGGSPGGLPNVGGRPTSGPRGVPQVLLEAGGPPLSPQAAPPVSPAAAGVSAMQARLALLDQLASSQEVSEVTREWARTVIETITGGAAGG